MTRERVLAQLRRFGDWTTKPDLDEALGASTPYQKRAIGLLLRNLETGGEIESQWTSITTRPFSRLYRAKSGGAS